jgi:hypothetical protein
MPENRLSSYLSTLEVCKRDDVILHRTGATAAGDLIAAPTITAAKDATAGVMAAAEHKVAVAVGTCYGYSTRSDIVAITPDENKSVLVTIPQVVGAESYVVFFSTDAAPKRLCEITEAQRAAGCVCTAVETVTLTGGTAGKVLVKLVGTGAATTAAIYATNLSISPGEIAVAGTTSSGAIDCTGRQTAYVRAIVNPGALASMPALTIVPFVKTGDQWAPGTPGIVTAGVRSETFTADVRGASALVVAVKTITSGATADVTVQLV